MADLGSVGLVLAGSAGPIIIAVITQRWNREHDRRQWIRDDSGRSLDLYARFLGQCTQIVADWSDYAKLPPRSADEERELDERRDVHYAELNTLAAMVRISAPAPVAQAAEEVLAALRMAREQAMKHATEAGRGNVEGPFAAVEAEFAESRQAFVSASRSAWESFRRQR